MPESRPLVAKKRFVRDCVRPSRGAGRFDRTPAGRRREWSPLDRTGVLGSWWYLDPEPVRISRSLQSFILAPCLGLRSLAITDRGANPNHGRSVVLGCQSHDGRK